jgi:hypothetical protein
MNRRLFVLILALLPWCQGMAATPDIASTLEQAVAAYARVDDYTCRMSRKERLEGDNIKEHSTVHFKYKRPGRYYMRWPSDLIELIYGDGLYNNKMVIHGGKLFSFASVEVDPALALKYNRHTIREAGMGHVLDLILKNYRQSAGDPEASIVYSKDDVVDNRPTWRFTGTFPAGRGYYGHIVHLDIDQALHLPVRIEVYGWKDEFLEAYAYTDLRLNVGLSEADFDIHNPAYRFDAGEKK